MAVGLAEEPQDRLGDLVGLAEHGGAGLLQDLGSGEVDHFCCHVHVADSGLRSGQVLAGHLQVGDGAFQTVLDRTEIASLCRDRRDSSVNQTDRGAGTVNEIESVDAQLRRRNIVNVHGDLVRATCVCTNLERGPAVLGRSRGRVQVKSAREAPGAISNSEGGAMGEPTDLDVEIEASAGGLGSDRHIIGGQRRLKRSLHCRSKIIAIRKVVGSGATNVYGHSAGTNVDIEGVSSGEIQARSGVVATNGCPLNAVRAVKQGSITERRAVTDPIDLITKRQKLFLGSLLPPSHGWIFERRA